MAEISEDVARIWLGLERYNDTHFRNSRYPEISRQYQNWNTGEPNNLNDKESNVQMYTGISYLFENFGINKVAKLKF